MKTAREIIAEFVRCTDLMPDDLTSRLAAEGFSIVEAGRDPVTKAVWRGDENALPNGANVDVLACDPEDPSVPARMACWIRHWPKGRDFPAYRSCDLSDLEMSDEAFDALSRSTREGKTE